MAPTLTTSSPVQQHPNTAPNTPYSTPTSDLLSTLLAPDGLTPDGQHAIGALRTAARCGTHALRSAPMPGTISRVVERVVGVDLRTSASERGATLDFVTQMAPGGPYVTGQVGVRARG